MNRAQFLTRAAAVGAAAVAAPLLMPTQVRAADSGLRHRGVMYEVATGETPATGWNAARMRTDIRAIRDRLHANTLAVFGDGVDRLKATASEAAERGLHVYLQPRLGDRPQREILEHLAETGRHAERLRGQGARVILSVGLRVLAVRAGHRPW